MAKVMISVQETVLREIDAEARRVGATRSGLIQQWARDALAAESAQRSAARAASMAEIDAESDADPRRGHGGSVAEAVKAARPR